MHCTGSKSIQEWETTPMFITPNRGFYQKTVNSCKNNVSYEQNGDCERARERMSSLSGTVSCGFVNRFSILNHRATNNRALVRQPVYKPNVKLIIVGEKRITWVRPQPKMCFSSVGKASAKYRRKGAYYVPQRRPSIWQLIKTLYRIYCIAKRNRGRKCELSRQYLKTLLASRKPRSYV